MDETFLGVFKTCLKMAYMKEQENHGMFNFLGKYNRP